VCNVLASERGRQKISGRKAQGERKKKQSEIIRNSRAIRRRKLKLLLSSRPFALSEHMWSNLGLQRRLRSLVRSIWVDLNGSMEGAFRQHRSFLLQKDLLDQIQRSHIVLPALFSNYQRTTRWSPASKDPAIAITSTAISFIKVVISAEKLEWWSSSAKEAARRLTISKSQGLALALVVIHGLIRSAIETISSFKIVVTALRRQFWYQLSHGIVLAQISIIAIESFVIICRNQSLAVVPIIRLVATPVTATVPLAI